jgi:AbrB family looped-hinge helix DNA binding protein
VAIRAVAKPRIQERGQVTLPKQIRERAGMKPGDKVFFHYVGPGRIEICTYPRMTMSEMIERYQVDEPLGDLEAILREEEEHLADEFR